jgi:peptide/nickel transport system ATP-binding protein/oligopeptide transport system ATP-binding protein
MIFQEPMTSLNPVYSVGQQIIETIMLHQDVGKQEARDQTLDLLVSVGIDNPSQRIDNYPHQLSGGMRQRVLIAMAISCNPRLLIADEPTTALDVTIQAQILDLLGQIQEERGMSIIMITHDLGVISSMCEQVAVMYLGKIVEHSSTLELFENPLHPYTKGLLKSIPMFQRERGKRERITSIPGVVPEPYNAPPGCPFEPRCSERGEKCGEMPPLEELSPGHFARCWYAGGKA